MYLTISAQSLPKMRPDVSKLKSSKPRLVLKWPGGKRWLFSRLAPLFDGGFDRYVEPFAGAAASFFSLRPKNALLADTNKELMECYTALKTDAPSVWKRLVAHQASHTADENYYYRVRSSSPTSLVGRAARLIYLNRTCFNGIYRVNRNGIFNVPKGTKDTVVFPDDDFAEISKILRAAQLRAQDFEKTLLRCGAGDIVFVDPPYTVKHNLNGFIKYNEKIFSWDDQIRLSVAVAAAAQRGAKIIVTNAAHPSIVELYAEYGAIRYVSRPSVMAADPAKRNSIEELIILMNFLPEQRDSLSSLSIRPLCL